MALSSSRSLDASPEAAFAALISQENAQAVADRVGGGLESHEVTTQGESTTTVTVFTLPSDRLPEIVAKLMSNGVAVTLEETWGPAAADGARTSTISASVKGAPVKVSGSETLSADGTGSVLALEGEVSSSIPFLGGKISKAAEPFLDRLLAVRCQAIEAA
ncbi:DUF2505 domain-containing protein [Galactobacter valiniphilus]|uniref:DUF2505 domain-containing protein n=1 Tax=Galactobacter valiniphilus TaxID=2676122 RepID=A0A399J8U9_9MICC|nr:DUF2505 domain-containing protein [Galactobacter valiniphilus]RII41965.1 DUF2505 domain-containing protein [Galactobacter valiniphilus]